jgi:hypothetical protein
MIIQQLPSSDRHRLNVLADRIERLRHVTSGGYRLAVLDFRLTPFAESRTHTRLAMHLMKQEVSDHGGEVHEVNDFFLFCIIDGKQQESFKHSLQTVFKLAPAWGDGDFIATFHISRDEDKIKEVMAQMSGMVGKREREVEKAKLREDTARINCMTPITADEAFATARFSPVVQLEFIESQLPTLNFRELVRSQAIGRFNGDQLVEVIGQELSASVLDLQKRLSTKIDLDAHYLLRLHLIQTLADRLLDDLRDRRILDSGKGPFFLNLQIANLHGRAFHEFDAAIGEARANIVIDIDLTDVLAHAGLSFDVCAPLIQRGYGVGLSGVTLEALEEIEVDRLPIRYIKLIRHGDAAIGPKGEARLEAMRKRGVTPILSQCDRKNAIGWGRFFHLEYCQGAAVDEIAAKAFHAGCAKACELGCGADRCRLLHWVPYRLGNFRCPRPVWSSPG